MCSFDSWLQTLETGPLQRPPWRLAQLPLLVVARVTPLPPPPPGKVDLGWGMTKFAQEVSRSLHL